MSLVCFFVIFDSSGNWQRWKDFGAFSLSDILLTGDHNLNTFNTWQSFNSDSFCLTARSGWCPPLETSWNVATGRTVSSITIGQNKSKLSIRVANSKFWDVIILTTMIVTTSHRYYQTYGKEIVARQREGAIVRFGKEHFRKKWILQINLVIIWTSTLDQTVLLQKSLAQPILFLLLKKQLRCCSAARKSWKDSRTANLVKLKYLWILYLLLLPKCCLSIKIAKSCDLCLRWEFVQYLLSFPSTDRLLLQR